LLVILALGSLAVGPCGDRSIGALGGDGAAVPGDAAPGDGGCPADACLALGNEYTRAVASAKSCTLGAAGACQVTAPASLRCGGVCPTVVNDRGALDEIRDRWRQAGCDGCFAGAPCPVCTAPVAPMCTPTASVTGQTGNASCEDTGVRTCPAGLETGSPCVAPDACMGGSHTVCVCSSTGSAWACS